MGPVAVERVPVLTYHSLDDSGSPVSIAPARFRQQMEWLRDNGWRTLTLDQFLDGHARGAWSPRSCHLTFDDGFASFADHALQVLKACGFTATVFVVAGWVGRTNDWPSQPSWAPRHALMGWRALRDIADEGMEIGGHTCSHPHLEHLDRAIAEREIIDCKRVIEDQLGQNVRVFAYPYGETSKALQDIVATHFRAGLGTRLGFVTRSSSTSTLERIDAYYLREPRLLRVIHSEWFDSYLHMRQWLRDLRQRGPVGFLTSRRLSA